MNKKQRRVLIHLGGGFGLGDCVQFSIVLKHLRQYRPEWLVDVQTIKGAETALFGLCNRSMAYDEPHDDQYDQKIVLDLNEFFCGTKDRPNSKAAACVTYKFGLPYDPELGRYECHQPYSHNHKIEKWLRSIGARVSEQTGKWNVVLLHYQGSSSNNRKDLEDWQASEICRAITATGRLAVLLDWRRKSPLADQKNIFCPGVGPGDIWGGFGNGDAATLAVLISCCEAYVGIDSGPGKIASATDTPTLICWTKLHPSRYHDPAPNTTHLLPPRDQWNIDEGEDILWYFERHYKYEMYHGDHGLIGGVISWVNKTLGIKGPIHPATFVLPPSIAGCAWALTKIRAIAGSRPMHVILPGSHSDRDWRAVPFLKRFPWIDNVTIRGVPYLHSPDMPTDSRGRLSYVMDGYHEGLHYLMPEGVLQHGRGLQNWLPEYPVDYDIFRQFNWEGSERGKELAFTLDPYVVFFLGDYDSNTYRGLNRGEKWHPEDWARLGFAAQERGLNVVVVGADWDRFYFDSQGPPAAFSSEHGWHNLIGKLEISETLALLRGAKVFFSYPSGLAVCAHYLGVRVATWWRRDGDSVDPSLTVCASEDMRTAWLNPAFADNYYCAFYGEETASEIVEETTRRGWL